MVNEVPVEYFCATDASGRRLDADERPELSSGSVEYVAPAEYMVRVWGGEVRSRVFGVGWGVNSMGRVIASSCITAAHLHTAQRIAAELRRLPSLPCPCTPRPLAPALPP